MKKFLIILAVILLVGCSQAPADSSEQVAPTEEVFLQDGESFELVASQVTVNDEGTNLTMLAYNGSIPGPSIYVEQGSEIDLKFVNNTKFDTSLHSHGLRLANEFDGVPGVTQGQIEPGDSFDYKLSFPDSGVYFYHPHTREDFQQDAGMYGTFVVLPKGEADSFEFLKNDNHYLVFLDDTDVRRWDTDTLDEGKVESTLMGSYGSRMFINGDLNNPYDLGEHALNDEIFVTFINSANVRPYNLQVDGINMVKIAGDASGFQKQDQISNLIIGPSERYTVRLDLDTVGDFEVVSTGGNKDYKIATVKVNDTITKNKESVLNELEIDAGLLESFYAQEVDKNIELTMNMDDSLMGGMMSGMPCHQMPDGSWMGDCEEEGHATVSDGIEWEDGMPMMNMMSDLSNVEWKIVDLDTGKSGMHIDWTFNQGDYVKILVTNNESSMHPMQHPFHIHGQRFLVLTKDGIKNDNLAWKDTVMIPAGETYELIVEMSNPGEWVAHCHIPEHMEAGMMMMFNII